MAFEDLVDNTQSRNGTQAKAVLRAKHFLAKLIDTPNNK
jgi:hypothetical protein